MASGVVRYDAPRLLPEMETTLDILRKTEAYLTGKGIERAKVDAEWLVAQGLGVPRLRLFLEHDRPLTKEQLAAIRPLVARRGKREPLAYILGNTPFLGLDLKCDARALIPRPETEELAERLLAQCREAPERVIDLGTGTGALALALANAWPDAQVTAVDTSAEALALAKENAERNGLAGRVVFRVGNWLEGVEGAFDVIVANPPYVTPEEWAKTEPDVREFEPKSALVAADAGLADLRVILAQAHERIVPGGLLALECGLGQPAKLVEEALALGYSHAEARRDLTRRERFVWAWR
ncbi:MAG: peptide chain release factor N(5)-glutamine methyltransferase [Opitutales bacterium]